MSIFCFIAFEIGLISWMKGENPTKMGFKTVMLCVLNELTEC